MPNLESVLRAAREAVVGHMTSTDAAEITWSEVAVTEVYLAAARDALRAATFNNYEEPRVGADWLWWFVDRQGEAFGMLIQAKRIHRTGASARHTFDFTHSVNGELQAARLRDSASILGVVPMYALYCGQPETRIEVSCSRLHHDDDCEACAPATVNVVPELVVRGHVTTSRVPADDILRNALPAEFLGRPGLSDPLARWFRQLTDDQGLQSFLSDPQNGARQIARYIFDAVGRVRIGQFAVAAPSIGLVPEPTTEARVFQQLPGDRGHFTEPYFEHVLRGLRTAPPDYVTALFAGERPEPSDLGAGVDGIAVFRIE